MLTARPRHAFSRTWEVFQDDAVVARLTPSMWREAAALVLPGEAEPLTFAREGWMSGAFVLRRGEAVAARARKPSAWRSAFALELGGVPVQLRPDSCFHSSFTLYEGDTPIGKISRAGFLRQTATLDLPGDWPLALRLFALWLVVVIWARDAQATTSSG